MDEFLEDYQKIIDFQVAYAKDPNCETLKQQCIEQLDDLFTLYTGLKEENKLQKQVCQLELNYWKKDQGKIERKQAIIHIISNYLFPEARDNLSILEDYHALNEQYLALVMQTKNQVTNEQHQLDKLKQFFLKNRGTVLDPQRFTCLTSTLFDIEKNQMRRGQRITRQSHQINAIYDGITTSFSQTTTEEEVMNHKIQKNIAILTKNKEKACSNPKNMIK